MPNVLKLTLPEPPSANRWWRKWQGRMVLSAEARAYKAAAYVNAKRHLRRTPVPTGSVAVTVDWYRSRRAGDLDKRLGVLLDALQGAAYENDSQVVELTARRFDDKQNPRVEVTVREVA
jgi:crossover junction endodeoxyribonuclease RusA